MEADSWFCNFIFSEILIVHVYEKQMKKRLSLKTQFKIEFLLPLTGSRKLLEKMHVRRLNYFSLHGEYPFYTMLSLYIAALSFLTNRKVFEYQRQIY